MLSAVERCGYCRYSKHRTAAQNNDQANENGTFFAHEVGCPREPLRLRSMTVLDVTQFAAYSRFTRTLNYIDRDAPPIKFSLWLNLRGVILCSWMTNDNGRHEKPHFAPQHINPSERCEVTQIGEACATFFRPSGSKIFQRYVKRHNGPQSI
jgi:hypothetical protein